MKKFKAIMSLLLVAVIMTGSVVSGSASLLAFAEEDPPAAGDEIPDIEYGDDDNFDPAF